LLGKSGLNSLATSPSEVDLTKYDFPTLASAAVATNGRDAYEDLRAHLTGMHRKNAPAAQSGRIQAKAAIHRTSGRNKTMRVLQAFIVIATSALGGTALAADMSGADIKAFNAGNTIYLETTAASASGNAGQGVIYWGTDGTALYKTPSGAIMHGTWEVKGNTNCTVWKERPNTGCTRYDKTGDVVTVIDATSGQVRAKIVKTAPGNVEKLTP
jgi:hypothetical protein